MGLMPGARIGPYVVSAPLGAGGMGEVYRARDTRLGRDVAIKALPDQFSSDPSRLLRFEREAQLLASVSHPNLAAIHGMEEVDGSRYLALEYVEGETLAARIARGPLPVAEAIEVCLQIAAGMEAAHEEGVVHRDLKPGNVMITPADEVKVLDFGLAKGKVVEWEEMSPESPTVTMVASPVTMPGVILGTASYLSPEQARGKPVDRRTDIWSFGCVLYECLTGRKAFDGETVSDVIARILGGDVEWGRLPKETPVRLRELLERCLERDPRRRLRDMGDARLTLEEIREGRGGAVTIGRRPRILSARMLMRSVLFAVAIVGGGIVVRNWNPPPDDNGMKRFQIQAPPSMDLSQLMVGMWVSPDGRSVFALGGTIVGGQITATLLKRPIGGGDYEQVATSQGILLPRFTSDGHWIYFLGVTISGGASVRRLWKMPVDGSTPAVRVADCDPTWGLHFVPLVSGDVLVPKGSGAAFVRIPAGGGAPSEAIRFDVPGASGKIDLLDALPGDRGVFVAAGGGIGVIDPETGKGRMLLDDGSSPRYSPRGHLLFSRRSTLLAVPFNLDRLEVRGEPVAILDGLRAEWGGSNGAFEVSRRGILTYVPGGIFGNRRRFVVVETDGRVADWSPERRSIDGVSVDPSGNRVAFTAKNAEGATEIWISERGAGSSRRVLTMPDTFDFLPSDVVVFPAWSPDGKQISFWGDGGVYVLSLDGGRPRKICELRRGDSFISLVSAWYPDGRALLGSQVSGLGGGAELVRIPIPAERESLSAPVPLEIVSKPPWAFAGRFSPDARWISYCTTHEGVNVVRYHPNGMLGMPQKVVPEERVRYNHQWSRSGTAIFYVPYTDSTDPWATASVNSVSLLIGPTAVTSAPVARWALNDILVSGGSLSREPWSWDILPGDRLLAVVGESEEPPKHVEVVTNFFDEVERKVKAAEG